MAWIGIGMKVGSVWDRGRLYPTARLRVERANVEPALVVGLIDTGFTGWLALPPNMVEQLGLKKIDSGTVEFGDLTRQTANLYEARVLWCDRWYTITVHELPGEPTIGMELLRGHRIQFDALRDADVDIEPVVPIES